MVKDDGKQWLLELTQSITSQLKQDRVDIDALWEQLNRNRETHSTCREQVLTRFAAMDLEFTKKLADLDKRIEIAMLKVGALISGIVILGEFLLNKFLG